MALEMYNVDEDGIRNYLSAGEEPYPACLFVLFVCFAIQTVVWIVVNRKQRSHIKGIHHLMTFVLVFKALNLFFEAVWIFCESGEYLTFGLSSFDFRIYQRLDRIMDLGMSCTTLLLCKTCNIYIGMLIFELIVPKDCCCFLQSF
jgi:hypothetical protein